jgi:hypothetical protein
MPNISFSKCKESLLRDYLGGMGLILLSKKYSIPKNTIHYNLSKLKAMRSKKEAIRKYEINEDFFATIDAEEKAYLLGFIYADGCLNGIQLNVTIHPKDVEIIHTFIEHISPSRIPSIVKNFYVKFGVYNRKLSDDLRKCGITERKSLIATFPGEAILPKHLHSHFIRGIFDGDGSVFTLARGNRQVVKIIGSKFFAPDLEKILKHNNIVSRRYTKGNVEEVVVGKKAEILKFYNFLYKDATLFLKRKYCKFVF